MTTESNSRLEKLDTSTSESIGDLFLNLENTTSFSHHIRGAQSVVLFDENRLYRSQTSSLRNETFPPHPKPLCNSATPSYTCQTHPPRSSSTRQLSASPPAFCMKAGTTASWRRAARRWRFQPTASIRQLGKNPQTASPKAPCFEIALCTPDVAAALERALAAGATPMRPLEVMPWGQTIAYVADINGFLVELCTPMA